MVKVHGTNAVEYAQEKLGFVEDFTEGEVKVRIKNTKSSDLRKASITYRLKGHPNPTHIETVETRFVKKAIDMLADKATEKIAKDQDKYEARKRKRIKRAEKERLKQLEELEKARLEEEFEVSA